MVSQGAPTLNNPISGSFEPSQVARVLNTIADILAATSSARRDKRGNLCLPTATSDRVSALTEHLYEEVVSLPLSTIAPLYEPLIIYKLILLDIQHILSSSDPIESMIEISDDTIDRRLDDFVLQFQEALDLLKARTGQQSSPNSTHVFMNSYNVIVSGGNFSASTSNPVVHDPLAVVREQYHNLLHKILHFSASTSNLVVFHDLLAVVRERYHNLLHKILHFSASTSNPVVHDPMVQEQSHNLLHKILHQEAEAGNPLIPSDKLEHSWTTTCWIAAEHALQHARNNILLVSEVFERWQIQESEYIVHAGFDESLIKSGVGYLEQIHVFVSAEVDAASQAPLFSELGRLFSPFSSILFTESSSYRLPVFKDDGSVWEFDELIYFTASKFADGGSSAKTPLTIISLSQTPSLADGTTSFSQSSSGSGEGGKGKKRRLEKGKERDMGDKDEADKGSDNPENPPGDQGGIIVGPVEISFEIASEIHLNDLIQDKQNTFQTLLMLGSLTIEMTPLALNPPQFSERSVQFTELTFNTKPPTDMIAYKQFYLRVVIDSQQKNAKVKDIKPKRTPDSDGQEKRSSSRKSGQNRGMTAVLNLGLHPQAAITHTAMNTYEETAASEKQHNNSVITQYHGNGNVEWGFSIDDVNLQKRGIDVQEDDLPTAHFKFIGDNNVPAPPPKDMDIVITSYWSMILPSEPKNTWIRKLLHFFRSTSSTQTTSYSNLFQIVAMKADLSSLREPSHYKANVEVRSGACSPPDIKRQAADSVEMTLAVIDPKKLNLPMIEKFRLSDNCIPTLGCDSKNH